MFLPISKEDMQERGIEQFDFICITGDSYVDHPSFGIPLYRELLRALDSRSGSLHSLTGTAFVISRSLADRSMRSL